MHGRGKKDFRQKIWDESAVMDGKQRLFPTLLLFQSMGPRQVSVSLMLSPAEPAHALGCPRTAMREPRGYTTGLWRGSELSTALAPPVQPGHPTPPVPHDPSSNARPTLDTDCSCYMITFSFQTQKYPQRTSKRVFSI